MSDNRIFAHPLADTTTQLLSQALQSISAEDLQLLLDALSHNPSVLPLGGAERSTAYRSLVLAVNKTLRGVHAARNLVDRARLVAELATLKRRLMMRYLSLRDETPTAADEPAAAEPAADPTLDLAIERVYQRFAQRTPVAEEVAHWRERIEEGLDFHVFMLQMENGAEAKRVRPDRILVDQTDGEAVQTLFEAILARGAHPRDIDRWTARLRSGSMDRVDLAATLLDAARQEQAAESVLHDGLSCRVMGTPRDISVHDWKARAAEVKGASAPTRDPRYHHRFAIHGERRVLVSAICSLYRGGDFIERFMENICSQSIFDSHSELVIVDADSPEDEARTIQRYLARHPNIQYLRMNSRVSIYDAWNIGARKARGAYLTNTNLDDLRRRDSFELQAGVLDALPFVDIAYQDFYYSFDPTLSWEQVAAFGYESDLPVVTAYNMLTFNSPHNAPMWRRRLHEELGYFDTHYKSAGDYEFWLRCLAAGKTFYKLNDPHVVYYQNPKGLSTRPDSRGVVEAREILKKYSRRLTDPNMVLDADQFARHVSPHALPPAEHAAIDRYALVQQELRQAAARLNR